jgi:hypothetical protein
MFYMFDRVFGGWVGLVGPVKASWGLLIEEGTPLHLMFRAREQGSVLI